jgi:hypothetical protein
MEPSNELAIEAPDEREWELTDEELDRTNGAALGGCGATMSLSWCTPKP